MDDTIDQFMWGFQPHFRIRVELGVGKALSQIGLPVDVRVVLVGFALDCSLRHQLCIEPEVGPLSVNHLDGVLLRTNELLRANPESGIRISNPRYQELRPNSLYRRSRGDALVEAIEQAGVFKDLTFFASEGAPVGSYEVHTCVGVPTAALEYLPALDDSEVERVYVGRSLQHEVISECLQRADRAPLPTGPRHRSQHHQHCGGPHHDRCEAADRRSCVPSDEMAVRPVLFCQ